MAGTPRRVLLELFVAYQLAGGLIEHELAGIGVTAEEYAVYSVLSQQPQLTPTELSRRLGVPLSSAIFRVGKLIARGHAHRIPNPRDGRSAFIALTPAGLELMERARPAFERVLDRIESHLGRGSEDVQATIAEFGAAISAALAEARDEELLRRRAS